VQGDKENTVGLNEDVAAYAQELADAAGITDAAARDAFIKNDKVQAKVRSSLEATLREKGRAEAEFKKRQEEYAANLKIAESNAAVVADAQSKVKAYVEKFGELPGGGDPANPGAVRTAVADAIDRKTFDERIKATEGNTIGLVKSVAKITAKHLHDFNEEPDLDAIEKIAVEQGLTAERAYTEWRKPKDEERAKAASEAAIKKAREEGELEGRSKIAAGAITSAEPSSPFMANLRKSGEVKAGPKESFVQGWREAAQKSTGA
jgi:hypothetical protein